jgi:hypothetical protein
VCGFVVDSSMGNGGGGLQLKAECGCVAEGGVSGNWIICGGRSWAASLISCRWFALSMFSAADTAAHYGFHIALPLASLSRTCSLTYMGRCFPAEALAIRVNEWQLPG